MGNLSSSSNSNNNSSSSSNTNHGRLRSGESPHVAFRLPTRNNGRTHTQKTMTESWSFHGSLSPASTAKSANSTTTTTTTSTSTTTSSPLGFSAHFSKTQSCQSARSTPIHTLVYALTNPVSQDYRSVSLLDQAAIDCIGKKLNQPALTTATTATATTTTTTATNNNDTLDSRVVNTLKEMFSQGKVPLPDLLMSSAHIDSIRFGFGADGVVLGTRWQFGSNTMIVDRSVVSLTLQSSDFDLFLEMALLHQNDDAAARQQVDNHNDDDEEEEVTTAMASVKIRRLTILKGSLRMGPVGSSQSMSLSGEVVLVHRFFEESSEDISNNNDQPAQEAAQIQIQQIVPQPPSGPVGAAASNLVMPIASESPSSPREGESSDSEHKSPVSVVAAATSAPSSASSASSSSSSSAPLPSSVVPPNIATSSLSLSSSSSLVLSLSNGDLVYATFPSSLVSSGSPSSSSSSTSTSSSSSSSSAAAAAAASALVIRRSLNGKSSLLHFSNKSTTISHNKKNTQRIVFEPIESSPAYHPLHTPAVYPLLYRFAIPEIDLDVELTSCVPQQQVLTLAHLPLLGYWQGHMMVKDRLKSKAIITKNCDSDLHIDTGSTAEAAPDVKQHPHSPHRSLSATVGTTASASNLSQPQGQYALFASLRYFPPVETSSLSRLDKLFKNILCVLRREMDLALPLSPSEEQIRALVAGAQAPQLDPASTYRTYTQGMDAAAFIHSVIKPLREIIDRGGKAWRSYALLLCLDCVTSGQLFAPGPSRSLPVLPSSSSSSSSSPAHSIGSLPVSLSSEHFLYWLPMPELMHAGSLIVDDVEDRSMMRRGGSSAHVIYGEPLAINCGTNAYFLSLNMLHKPAPGLTDAVRFKIYEAFFTAMRGGHVGQGLDIYGVPVALVNDAVATGKNDRLLDTVVCTHRLKCGAMAGFVARIGGLLGHGTPEQVEALALYFESIGIAFQIIDDVLGLKGFQGGKKEKNEDITAGKVTHPVAIALSSERLDANERAWLWRTLQSQPTDESVVDQVGQMLFKCGAVADSMKHAASFVDAAWVRVAHAIPDSYYKALLRAFGDYVLQRQY